MNSADSHLRSPDNDADSRSGTADEHLRHPRARTAFRRAKLLVGGYLAISALTFVAIVLLRDDAAVVNDAVWIRASIVVASALLLFAFAVRAARGSRGAYLRLRIVTAIMVVAIAVTVALPGVFPLWMKVEQGVCGLLLIGVIAIVNTKNLRSLFAGGNPRTPGRSEPISRF